MIKPWRSLLQNLCNHHETQVYHWVLPSGYCISIRAGNFHDIPCDQTSRYMSFIPGSFKIGVDADATSFYSVPCPSPIWLSRWTPLYVRRAPSGGDSLYGSVSILWWVTRRTLRPCLIYPSGIYDRRGGIYCHYDPPAVASPIFRQDTVHSTDHRQGRDPLRPPSVHRPHHLRVLVGLRPGMRDTCSVR